MLLLGYIFVLTTAGAGVTGMAILHARLRTAITRWFLLVTACFITSLFLTVLAYYTQVVELMSVSTLPVRNVLGVALAVVIYGGMALIAISVSPRQRLAVKIATAAVLALQIARAVVFYYASPQAVRSFRLPAIVVISAWLCYVGLVLYRSQKAADADSEGALVRRVGFSLVLFGPASAIVYAGIDRIPESVRPFVSFDYVYALVLSGIIISVFLEHLSRPKNVLGSAAVTAGFIRAFGITPREAQIIGLIGEGLTNQEIADRLFVSLTTVRTHVYNVFQKTGAKSRVDLLRLVSGYSE